MSNALAVSERLNLLTSSDFLLRPPMSLRKYWLSAKASDLLASVNVKGTMDVDTYRYFGFVWSQVSEFGCFTMNAFNIAAHLRVSPLAIAIYVNEYGLDWHKIFRQKRLLNLERASTRHIVFETIDDRYVTPQLLRLVLERETKVRKFCSLLCQDSIKAAQAYVYSDMRCVSSSLARVRRSDPNKAVLFQDTRVKESSSTHPKNTKRVGIDSCFVANRMSYTELEQEHGIL